MVKESIALSYQEGASDKVYNVELVEQSTGFLVNFAYGRRGNSLLTGAKTKEPVTYEVAKKTFDKLVKSKTAKGYKEEGVQQYGINVVTDKEDSGIRPQLLNDISEMEANFFINDDKYCMQEKFDGRRKMITRNGEDSAQGVNKKGIVVAINNKIQDDCDNLQPPYILDGEDMGDHIMLFDDITNPLLSYKERYEWLNQIGAYESLRVVETAWTTFD
jgi:bifunctional non-homologous end joining protein LigD